LSKGTYALVLECKENKKIKVGKLGSLNFEKGYYVYVGSAMNSLEKRIERHKRKEKKKHWHIDYLTTNKSFKIIDVFLKISDEKEECEVAEKVKALCNNFVKNFGSSDCNCESHLFYFKSKEKMLDSLKKIFAP